MKTKFFFKNLMFFLIPIITTIILLGGLSIYLTHKFVKEDVNRNSQTSLNQIESNIDRAFYDLYELDLLFGENSTIPANLKKILSNDYLTYESSNSLRILTSFLNAPANSKPYVHSIYVYLNNDNGRYIQSSVGLTSLEESPDVGWYESYEQNKSTKDVWSEIRYIKDYSFEKSEQKVVTIYSELSSEGGVIVLNLRSEYYDNLLLELTTIPEQRAFVINEDGIAVFQSSYETNDQEIIEKVKPLEAGTNTIEIDGKTQVVNKQYSDYNGWSYLLVTPLEEIYAIPNTLIITMVVFLFFAFILGTAITFYLTKIKHERINHIVSIIEAAEKGGPIPNYKNDINDEYEYIVEELIKTFLEKKYLKVAISEKQYKLRTAELLALQSQINPHFIYNTLHSIYWEAFKLSGAPNNVTDMTTNLSNIMHYSLTEPCETIHMNIEVKNTKSYIDLQKFRYGDKFEVIWNIDDEGELEKYYIPKLILQPFIENCIYHGIMERETHGKIKIKIRVYKNTLRIHIIDNGIGIEKERLLKIQESLNKDTGTVENIGIQNTNKRLKLIYDKGYKIKINSKKMMGTIVTIYIDISSTGV